MDNYIKVIHEFYYVVGHKDFHSHYKLAVDRETEKMLYGDVWHDTGSKSGRFAIKKENIDEINEVVDKKYGTVYRIQIIESDTETARLKAKDMVYNYLFEIAEDFKNSKGDV